MASFPHRWYRYKEQNEVVDFYCWTPFMTQLLGEFVSHYSKIMHFILENRNIRKFSPVWVCFRVSTVLPFKKWVEKMSYSQFDWAILKYLPIQVFMFSILGIRWYFFPSLSCKKHLLAWVHDINLLWLCHVGLAAFQTSIFAQSFKEKKIYGEYCSSMELMLPFLSCCSLSVQQLHPHWGSALWEKTKWETFCCIKLSLSVIMLHVNVPNLSTSIIVYLSAWPFCQRMWHFKNLPKTLHSCWKSFVEVTCSYFSFFFFFLMRESSPHICKLRDFSPRTVLFCFCFF